MIKITANQDIEKPDPQLEKEHLPKKEQNKNTKNYS